MKKIKIIFIALLGFVPAKIGAALFDTTALNGPILKDGTSFQSFEDSIRKKYKNLPKINLLELGEKMPIAYKSFDKMSSFWGYEKDYGQDAHFHRVNDPFLTTPLMTDTNFCEKYFNPAIIVSPSQISKITAPQMEWAILHEAGHLTKPGAYDYIPAFQQALQAYVLAFWGAHKSKPYKNIISKSCSKTLAALMASLLFNSLAIRAEEKRADRWANNHADEQALRGGISFFEDFAKPLRQNMCAQMGLPYISGQALIDPSHPSDDSRISKMKKALKTRFGVDA